jgi:hypothetical protein
MSATLAKYKALYLAKVVLFFTGTQLLATNYLKITGVVNQKKV